MEDLLVLIPLLPLAAAVINFLLRRWFIKDYASCIATASGGACVVLSLLVVFQIRSDETSHLRNTSSPGSPPEPSGCRSDYCRSIT